jgi:integration host factor subunit beta
MCGERVPEYSPLTKLELIDAVVLASGLTRSQVEPAIDVIFESMTRALAQGDGVEIRGFGNFTVRQYKAYEGRNPRTGAAVHVAPKRLPHFRVGKDLNERLNSADRSETAKHPESEASPPERPRTRRVSSGDAHSGEKAQEPPAKKSKRDRSSEDSI